MEIRPKVCCNKDAVNRRGGVSDVKQHLATTDKIPSIYNDD